MKIIIGVIVFIAGFLLHKLANINGFFLGWICGILCIAINDYLGFIEKNHER